ncbi:hypothetical protein Micbo1qcDRAFT_5422 [Microdochium bolleyi]|uniref:Uncharacterized protein n=1 Tax=Microdochium bolleyi TaxID=196109 RepID=A0A136JJ09_9PEZI|nr:hypothetical protein Micbo1qcDRAFT_5422 [Microdochium bolleyi]
MRVCATRLTGLYPLTTVSCSTRSCFHGLQPSSRHIRFRGPWDPVLRWMGKSLMTRSVVSPQTHTLPRTFAGSMTQLCPGISP